MMTKYSPLKKFAAFGFAAMVLAACAAPSYTTGSGSASSASAGGAGGSAASKYLVENVGDRVFSRQTGRFLMLHLAAPWCVRPNG